MAGTWHKGVFYKNMSECELCGCEDKPLTWVGGDNCGDAYCEDCEEFERNFDIDKFEEEKRSRIARENEY